MLFSHNCRLRLLPSLFQRRKGFPWLHGVCQEQGVVIRDLLHPKTLFSSCFSWGLWNLPQSLQNFKTSSWHKAPIKSFALGSELWWSIFLRFLHMSLTQAFSWDSRKPRGSRGGEEPSVSSSVKRRHKNSLPTVFDVWIE